MRLFLFVGNVNDNHKEWLVLSTMNLHGRASGGFAYSLSFEQIDD